MFTSVFRRWSLGIVGAFVLLTATGCDPGKPPEAVALADVPQVLQEGFKDAKSPVKEGVAAVVKAVEAKDWAQASLAIQELTAQPGLKKPQQELAARCMIAINAQVAEAAEAGDEEAAEVRQIHRSEK